MGPRFVSKLRPLAASGRQGHGAAALGALRAVGTSILTYWYYHVPNFVLAALMYTLLGRAVLGMFVDADSPNYIWRFFCRITDPVVAAVGFVTPKAAAPVRMRMRDRSAVRRAVRSRWASSSRSSSVKRS